MTRDLLWAARWLRKNPLFATAVVAILALGIGANTAVFGIVDAVLLRPLPYAAADRLVRIEQSSPKRSLVGTTAADYLLWRDHTDLFEKIAAYRMDVVTLTGTGDPDQLTSVQASPGLFSMLGVRAELGRTLLPADEQLSGPNPVVLSDRLWRRLFHADPGAIGRPMTLSGELFTIAGVMPPEFEFPFPNVELWVPLHVTPASVLWVHAVGRLKRGVSLAAAQGAMDIVAREAERQDPQKRAGLEIEISPWREVVEREYELTLIFILAAVGLVLLIACANVGSLLLSRAVQRQREIAIRASLGAGFWRVVRQLLAESFVLALLGSVAGVAAAHYALAYLSRRMNALPIAIPHLRNAAIDGRVFLFATALCFLLACLCSVAPLLLASKTDLQAVLRAGHGTGGSKASTRLFSILIASEAGFAFLLLVGSGLMIRSLVRLEQVDHGFHPDQVLTMRVPIGSRTQLKPTGQYDTKPRQMEFYRDVLERLARTPGVRAAAVVNNLPLSGFNTSTPLNLPDGRSILLSTRTISPQYFSVMGIPLLAGRSFSESDQTGAPAVAIVNEYLAHQLFGGRNPIGQALPPENGNVPVHTVVGVVRDTPQSSYAQAPTGELYLPYRQYIFGVFLSTIVVRASGDPLSLASTLRKQVWAVDPNEPVVKIETMDDVIADSIWRPRFSAWLFSVLGGLALLLTSAGVYGVIAYTTNLRLREVGIRVALGATPANIAAVVVRDAMMPLAAGLAIGVAAALLLSRLLSSLLYEIGATDPLTYLSAAALLLAIGAAASAHPAWKAAVGDPLEALRTE